MLFGPSKRRAFDELAPSPRTSSREISWCRYESERLRSSSRPTTGAFCTPSSITGPTIASRTEPTREHITGLRRPN